MYYLWVFLIGGLVCAIGELLIIKTNITSARILVTFVLTGVLLEAFGLFDYISDFARAGINVPIAKGAIGAVKARGLIGAFTGGLEATAAGIAAAVGFAFLFGLIFHARTKN